MSATPGSDIRSGIGARLRAGRERMGMTLLQVAEKLHVDAKSLEAVEAERFGELGAPVYAKGHLKRYSELVGENTAQLLDEYTAATKPVLPDLTQLPKASQHADPRKLVLPSLVVLIAFVLVGTVWWVLQNFQRTALEPRAIPATTSENESASAAPGGAVAPDNPSATAPASAATTPPSAATTPAAAAAGSSANRTRGGAGLGTGAPAGAAANAQSPQGAAAASPAETPRGRSVDVTLKFATDSWVEVYDANGQRLFYDIGSANSSRTLTGTPPLRVVLGNAPGVSLNINGKPAKVPASAVQQDSAQFTINRSGRIVRARPDGAASPASRPNGD
jgi:cytoskeleton protein RodZ